MIAAAQPGAWAWVVQPLLLARQDRRASAGCSVKAPRCCHLQGSATGSRSSTGTGAKAGPSKDGSMGGTTASLRRLSDVYVLDLYTGGVGGGGG